MLNYSGARYVQQYNHSIINITSMLNMSLVSHSVTPKLLQCLGCITAIMAYCNTWSSAVCLSVCLSVYFSVYLLVTFVSPVKISEPIKMPFAG